MTERPMKNEGEGERERERSIIDRLVFVADAIFSRATTLEAIKLSKREDEAAKMIEETRDQGFHGVIEVWDIILDMLPTATISHDRRHELEVDAHKISSRCHHRLGEHENAKKAITKAIDLGYADGFISLGAICLDAGEYEEAENAFKTAVAKDAQATRAHAGLGELYFQMGTLKLQKDPEHREYFQKAEAEFIAAGRERFLEAYERAMDLFAAIGWQDKAASFAERAALYYTEHRLQYGDKLRTVDSKLRKLAGDERYSRLVARVGRGLGQLMGGTREPDET